MSTNFSWFLHKKEYKQPNSMPAAPLKVLEATNEGDKTRLSLSFSSEFHCELYDFLEKQGFLYFGHEKHGLPQLLQYGLSDKSRAELIKNRDELDLSRYAAMRFQSAEYFQQNMAFTLRLRQALNKNRALKRELRERGIAGQITNDLWDNWDEGFIAVLHQRYLPFRQAK